MGHELAMKRGLNGAQCPRKTHLDYTWLMFSLSNILALVAVRYAAVKINNFVSRIVISFLSLS